MTVYWQQNAKSPVEAVTAEPNAFLPGYWIAQGNQTDLCGDLDCSCHRARVNKWNPDDSEAKAIIGLIQEYYEWEGR